MVLGDRTQKVRYLFAYRAITVYGLPFQESSAKVRICNFPTKLRLRPVPPHYPGCTTRAGFNVQAGLGSSRFARRYSGNRSCFLFLGVLRCFSSPRWPLRAMDSPGDSTALPVLGCPIRRSPDQRSLAPPRGLSQLATSFIAFLCQGIQHTPLAA